MKTALIVAKAKNNVIGHHGQLPWQLPDDLRFFKKMTMHHAIIMGRKTYLSIGRPLPHRVNIIMTRNKAYQGPQKSLIAHSLNEALTLAEKANAKWAFVIGGEQVYKEALQVIDRMYITEIQDNFPGDTFFPTVEWHKWKETEREKHPRDERHFVSFDFVCYDRV